MACPLLCPGLNKELYLEFFYLFLMECIALLHILNCPILVEFNDLLIFDGCLLANGFQLQIGERVAIWWRPNFETIMHPYCPPSTHNQTQGKKVKKNLIAQLHLDYFLLLRVAGFLNCLQ